MDANYDPAKLSPAPWFVSQCDWSLYYENEGDRDRGIRRIVCDGQHDHAYHASETWKSLGDAEFAALARNAFDVMIRRGWHPVRRKDKPGWRVSSFTAPFDMRAFLGQQSAPDPFTALIEGEAWYTANVEKS